MHVPLNELLFALSKGLDYVEQELLGITTHHCKRVAYICTRICQALGLRDTEVFDMACCAVLHDNALTRYILETADASYPRFESFKNHCLWGEKNARTFPFAGDASGIILYHHENWDGSGFHGLVADEIPVRCGALRVADNADLLLRPGRTRPDLADEMRDHVMRHRKNLYSPNIVDALLGLLDDEFLHDLSDERINAALKERVPSIQVRLNTKQMLRLCGLFALIIDAKSPFTKNHSSGVAKLVSRLADHYGLDEEAHDKLVIAAYLHDVGKLSIPAAILEKPGPLSAEEVRIMRKHAYVSGDILAEVSGLDDIADWCGNHHEKLDGHGYPHGLTETRLSFECRLLTCSDIYQALIEDRPYRAGMTHEQAVAVMEEMAKQGEIDETIVASIKNEFVERLSSIEVKELSMRQCRC